MAETAELLDVEEAGHFLHLKASTVRAWVIQRRIPYDADGLNYSQIADKLNRARIKTRYGGKWMPNTVRRIVLRSVPKRDIATESGDAAHQQPESRRDKVKL